MTAPRTRRTEDLVSLYLEDVRHHDRISPGDERRLGRLVRAGHVAEERLAAASTAAGRGLEPRRRAALEKAATDGRAAARRFVEANLRLVVSIAKHYRWSRVALLDLVQAGNLGLIHAVETFDPERGVRFSTYATWCIRRGIGREILDAGHTIRVPVHVAQHLSELHRTSAALELELARAPSTAELAAALGWSVLEVDDLRTVPPDPASLDGRPDGTALHVDEVVADPDGADPEAIVATEDVAVRIRSFVDGLDPRDRTVLELRYGLHDSAPRSCIEVAHVLGVSPSEVRRLERHAIGTLRRAGSGLESLAG